MYLISLLRISFGRVSAKEREPKSTKIHTDITLEVVGFNIIMSRGRVGSRSRISLFFRDIYIKVGLDWGVRRYANIFFRFQCCVRGAHERCGLRPRRCARAAGAAAVPLFITWKFSLPSPKHVDTSLLIFQMQMSR